MESYDDDLKNFEAHGAVSLPVTRNQGYVNHDGARIWYAAYGSGFPVVLLHGGLGHSGNWGYQLPALVGSGYRLTYPTRKVGDTQFNLFHPIRRPIGFAIERAILDKLKDVVSKRDAGHDRPDARPA